MKPLAPLFLVALAAAQAPAEGGAQQDGFPDDARRAAAAAELERVRSAPPAETHPAAALPLGSIVEETVAVSPRGDGSVVASGREWLARWVGERFTFSVFGASEEREDPSLSLRLEGLGRERGPAFAGVAAEPRLERQTPGTLARVERAVAAGVAERWDVRRDGVELSFVLTERPSGEGDLVATLDVQTGLTAPRGRALQGVSFTDADGQGVAVGAVTAVDAAGRTCAGWLDWDGQHLRLGVPGQFVDACAYPLVVDPVITGVLEIFGTSGQDADPVVAWDEASSTWAVAWARPVPAKVGYRWSVLVQRLYSWGGLRGTADVLESGASPGWDVFGGYDFLRIAPVTGPNLFVVAVGSEPPSGGTGAVLHWFPVDPASGFLGAGRTDFHFMKGRMTGLDLGTDPLPSYPNFLTVWREQGVGVWSALSTVDGADRVRGRDTGEQLVTGDGYTLTPESSVAVTSSAGAPGYWFVAWSTSLPANRLEGRVVSYYGSLVTPETLLESASFGTELVRLSASGDGHDYFVGYCRNDSTQRVRYRHVNFLGGATSVDPAVTLDAFPLPAVGSHLGAIARPRLRKVGEKTIAAWLRRTGVGDWTMHSATLSPWGGPILGEPVVMPAFGLVGRNLWLGTQSDAQTYPAPSDVGMIVTEGAGGIVRMFVRH